MSSSVSPARLVPWRRLLVVVAVLASVVVAFAGQPPATVGAQSGQCVTATNAEHEQAGRAERSFFVYRAVGSGDYMGFFSFSEATLQSAFNGWEVVDSCGPPGTGTTNTTDGPGNPGDRPPLEQQYQAMYETDWSLPDHTIYRPRNLDAVTELMPIVAWGNGACSANGTWFQEFLTPLSAHGVLVIASGTPNGSGQTNADMLIEAIDWAVDENTDPTSQFYGRLDTSAISLMGQSCGGIEAIESSSDPRVQSTVAWNSGLFGSGIKPALSRLHAPIAYFTGGPSDIAYGNALNDYQQIGSRVPAVIGHYGDVGHMNMFLDPEIERHIVTVAADWLDATLFDNAQARNQFVGFNCGLCSGTEWDMSSKNW